MVYARDIMERPGVVHSRREQYRLSSTDWHRFLGFETAYEARSKKSNDGQSPGRGDVQETSEEDFKDKWGDVQEAPNRGD